MTPERRRYLEGHDDAELTEAEMEEGYHWCADWDYDLVGPGTVEERCCTCHAKRQRYLKRIIRRAMKHDE
jgi:hypothetical protein